MKWNEMIIDLYIAVNQPSINNFYSYMLSGVHQTFEGGSEEQNVLIQAHPIYSLQATKRARFMGPTWCPSGTDRAKGGPMLAP